MLEKPLGLTQKWRRSHQQREAHLQCADELEAALGPLVRLVQQWQGMSRNPNVLGPEHGLWRETMGDCANELARALGMEKARREGADPN